MSIPLDNSNVEKRIKDILEHAGDRQSGDIAGQIMYLTQAVCLLARIVVELPGWMAHSR